MKRPSTSSAPSTVLITGASTGIGFELARVFARHGHGLVLVARNRERLQVEEQKLKSEFSVRINSLTADLEDPKSPQVLHDEINANGITIDILVNNAGFGSHGLFKDTDLKSDLAMIQLNVMTLTHLTKLYVKEMVKRGSGRILNVASTGAFQPGPLMAIYCASKAYVLHFSEAIANELLGSGVTITTLCPGATQSEFHNRARTQNIRLIRRRIMDATPVAESGYRGLMEGKPVVIPGFANRALAQAHRFAPRDLVTRLSRGAMESA
jgi:short-subunit dehydrogenase